MKYDLSILIPARNEMFLKETVQNILKNIRGNTEIIVVLDGAWSNPPLESHKDLTIVYNHEALGQRGATNQACRLSTAKYVMKIDAHCAVDEGFDVKMMALMQDDYTMIPIMYNLHAFDWICLKCSYRIYQSPTPDKCPKCAGKMKKDILWQPRFNRKSTAYRFDKTLHFQYWGEYKKIQDKQGDLADTLSIQGSCFMLTRKKYWELNICDEEFGSWGQQGTEVACKTWLSGGRVVVNMTTWYSHMFRTQGGDFGFPYHLSNHQVEKARKYSRELFLNDKWDKAIHPFSWLLEKFAPIPDWHDSTYKPSKAIDNNKGILYYTDNKLNLKLAHKVQKQIKKSGLPIISVSLKPMDFGRNIHLPLERGYLTMAKQILAGLEASTADIVFFLEHDVLYHPSHFEFTPPSKDKIYYNTNVWRVRVSDGHALYCDNLQQLSGLCAYRTTLLGHYRKRVAKLKLIHHSCDEAGFNRFVRAIGFEPATHNRVERVDDLKSENWRSEYPNLDIRHDGNLTPSRWRKEQFRNERYTRGWKESNVKDLNGWTDTIVFK